MREKKLIWFQKNKKKRRNPRRKEDPSMDTFNSARKMSERTRISNKRPKNRKKRSKIPEKKREFLMENLLKTLKLKMITYFLSVTWNTWEWTGFARSPGKRVHHLRALPANRAHHFHLIFVRFKKHHYLASREYYIFQSILFYRDSGYWHLLRVCAGLFSWLFSILSLKCIPFMIPCF